MSAGGTAPPVESSLPSPTTPTYPARYREVTRALADACGPAVAEAWTGSVDRLRRARAEACRARSTSHGGLPDRPRQRRREPARCNGEGLRRAGDVRGHEPGLPARQPGCGQANGRRGAVRAHRRHRARQPSDQSADHVALRLGRQRAPPTRGLGLRRRDPVRRPRRSGEIAPRDRSYVLTNALEVGYEAWFERIEAIARARGSVFVPVLLECELEEQLRRVASEDRVVRRKLSDPERAREFIAGTQFFRPTGAAALVVDTTHRRPDDTAALIDDHVHQITATARAGRRDRPRRGSGRRSEVAARAMAAGRCRRTGIETGHRSGFRASDPTSRGRSRASAGRADPPDGPSRPRPCSRRPPPETHRPAP